MVDIRAETRGKRKTSEGVASGMEKTEQRPMKRVKANPPAAKINRSLQDGPARPQGCHINISDPQQRKDLLFGLTQTSFKILSDITSLEVHLNPSTHDDYEDYKLATALACFHPDPDGSSNHKLQSIKIVVHGDIVCTQHDYMLASPATSHDITNSLYKFLNKGGLTQREQAGLPFKVNATETSVSRALLAIRGVPQVIVEEQGRALMEPCFKNLVKRTLVLPPGSGLDTQAGTDTFPLAREGEHCSYNRFTANSPYPTPDYGLHNMVRIMALEQDGEDLGLDAGGTFPNPFAQNPRGVKTDNEWLVLTGKGATVKLGWKV